MKSFKVFLILSIFLSNNTRSSNSVDHYKIPKQEELSKGIIKWKVKTFPESVKIEHLEYSLGLNMSVIQVDSLGSFSTEELNFGVYTIHIYRQDQYYPIRVENVVLDAGLLDLGNLPLFYDPYGYQSEWGELANEGGDYFHYRQPIKDLRRDSLETTYQSSFHTYSKQLKLHFQTIDVNIDTTDNIFDFWRFSVVESNDKQNVNYR